MSTGKATALSAGTCSFGTNSSSGSLPAGAAGGADGDPAGGGTWGAAAAPPRPGPARPSRAAASDTRTSDFSLIAWLLLLRVARDTETHVRPRLGRVVAIAQAQLGHRAVQVARSHDHVQLALGRAGRVALHGRVRGRDRIHVVHPLGHVAAEVVEPELVGA